MTPVEHQRSLQSSNPILSQWQFGRRGGLKTAARDQQQAGIAVVRDRIRAGEDVDQSYEDGPAPLQLFVGDLMTMDDVLARASVALGVTALAAVLSWTVLPVAPTRTAVSYGIAGAAALAAAALVVIQRRRHRPSPVLALTFAAVQGLFLGVLSSTVSTHLSPGVFVQMVLGTMAVSAGVVLAHQLHWMRVNRRFYGFVGAVVIGLGFLALADWMLFPVMGADGLGLRPLGLGVFMGVVGVLLAAPFLALHFRQVEDGIRHGTSRDHSWRAAFGLTLTLAWLYVETVRLFTLNPGDEFY